MLPLLSIGIAAGLILGLLSLGAAGKLYHLLCCKKKRKVSSDSHRPEDPQLKQEITTGADADAGWVLCWPKTALKPVPVAVHNTNNNNAVVCEDDDEDVELGFGLRMKSFVEEGVEAELMRLHNLSGPPRFLFTIKEETPEDLVSEDGNFNCNKTRTTLMDLMRSDYANFQLSPIVSPIKKSNKFVNNTLFECSVEAELNRLLSSPPPKFKFLRDAEEKLQKKLEAEQQQQLCSEVV